MLIMVKNISKRFGDFVAVDNVCFNVGEGDLVALLGPSGSGKSTILRIIAGLDTPDSGEIHLTGKEVTNLAPQKRKVGFVFQHYALFKHMTVEKNIAFGLEIRKRKKDHISERVAELIDLVKLQGYERHYPDQLSGGQRQRVALARSLAAEPRVLLLDEPFGALDAKVRDNLAGWLRDFHRKMKITTIFVTHDQNEAIEISDKIIVINHGRVEQEGSARDVYERPASRFVASFIGKVNVLDAVAAEGRALIKGTTYAIENSHVEGPPGSDLVVLVRPENINLHNEATAAGFGCRIDKIHYRGSHYDIDCSMGGVCFKVAEDKSSFARNNWREGQQAYFFFDSFGVFQADNGHAEIHRRLKTIGYIE